MKLSNVDFSHNHIMPGQPRAVPYYVGHILLYLGLLIITGVGLWLVIKTATIYSIYQRVTTQVYTIEQMLSGPLPAEDKAEIAQAMAATAHEVETLYHEAAPFLPLLGDLDWLPLYGNDLAALPSLLQAGRDLSRTGILLQEIAAPLLSSARTEDRTDGSVPALIARLAAQQPTLADAQQQLTRDLAGLNQLNRQQLFPALAHRAEQLRVYVAQASDGLAVAQALPSLLGFDQPKTYLVITQNADELRPGGGYINAAGHLVFEQGQITEFVMQDSYAVDRLSEAVPYPPAPLARYMAADYWVVRDASWSADFPTSAQTAIDLYQLGQGISSQGVIAIDQHALPYILQATGPLKVDGETVRPDNVIQLMHQHWAPDPGQDMGGRWWEQRKSFMLALAETIRQQIEQQPETIDLPQLIRGLRQALAEKHLLLYLPTSGLADLAAQKGWDGALQPSPGDYLMLTDANVGFNKASAVIERHIDYRATLTPNGDIEADLQLHYRHTGQKRAADCDKTLRYDPIYTHNMDRCYWNYASLIVPQPVRLEQAPQIVVEGRYLLDNNSTSGEIDRLAQEQGKTSWSLLFLLPPEEALTLDYAYSLPGGVIQADDNSWRYQLYLQKQPGSRHTSADITLTLPQGSQVITSHPAPAKIQATQLTYHLTLQTDQQLTVTYR